VQHRCLRGRAVADRVRAVSPPPSRTGGQGRGELVADLLRVRQVDLGGKRHDRGRATYQLLTHASPFTHDCGFQARLTVATGSRLVRAACASPSRLSGLFVLPAIPDINLALWTCGPASPKRGKTQDIEVNDRGRVPAGLSGQIQGRRSAVEFRNVAPSPSLWCRTHMPVD
jgi:hypothetical protein